ncbi:hypothetical protein Tco_1355916, partial [Tanacetum coccineum]
FRRSPSSFLLLTMEHLRDDIPISTGITASMPYVSENGLFSFHDMIMLACSGPTHLSHGLRNDFRYKVSSSMTYYLTLAFSRRAFPYYSGSVAFSSPALEPPSFDEQLVKSFQTLAVVSFSIVAASSTRFISYVGISARKSAWTWPRIEGSLRFIRPSKVTFLKQRFRVLKNGNHFFVSLDMHLMRLASFMFKIRTSFNVWGDGMFITTWAFSVQAWIPSLLMAFPRNIPPATPSVHFLRFSFMFILLNVQNVSSISRTVAFYDQSKGHHGVAEYALVGVKSNLFLILFCHLDLMVFLVSV